METSEKKWRIIYRMGAIAAIIVLAGIILDMIVGTVTGGNIAELPQTAIERFNQFHKNPLLGLYNLDLLNIINQLILIPSIFALYAVHRNTSKPSAGLALILFLVGTTIFVCRQYCPNYAGFKSQVFQCRFRRAETSYCCCR